MHIVSVPRINYKSKYVYPFHLQLNGIRNKWSQSLATHRTFGQHKRTERGKECAANFSIENFSQSVRINTEADTTQNRVIRALLAL